MPKINTVKQITKCTLNPIYKHPSNIKLKNRINNNGRLSHGVFLAEKWKNGQLKSDWYAKYLNEKRNEALAEILTQELMRLIHPPQPKTRRMIHIAEEKRIKYYILSKKIPKFDDKFFFNSENNESILINNITGLATTQVLALWLNEVDFKAGNVGIDPHKKTVIKIDGGLSLVTLNNDYHHLHNRNFNITSADLEALPNLIHYQACNWLHQIRWNKNGYELKTSPTELDKRINQSLEFKNELYRTILRIISLSDEFLQFFTASYISNSDDVKRFSDLIIVRKKQLASAAWQIPAFKEYCQSKQAQEETLDFLKYLKTFKTMGKYALCRAFKKKHKIDIVETIKEYTFLKKFTVELDTYLKRLNSVDFETSGNSDSSLEHSKITEYIESLKESVQFLTPSTLLEEGKLNLTLIEILKTIKNELVIQNTIISSLVESINNLLFANDPLKKIENSTPNPKQKLTSLSPMIFFNGQHQPFPSDYPHKNRCKKTN